MEIEVKPRYVSLKMIGGDFEITFYDLCFYMKPWLKLFKEAVVARTEVKQNIFIGDDLFFIYIGEEGCLSIFEMKTLQHLLLLFPNEALDLLEKMNRVYLQGNLFFRNKETTDICPCREGKLSWRDVACYHKRGLKLKPGDMITKEVIYHAYRILMEAYAQQNGLEPKSLMESCLNINHETMHPELNERNFWTLPYFLLKHENREAISAVEEYQEGRKCVFIL